MLVYQRLSPFISPDICRSCISMGKNLGFYFVFQVGKSCKCLFQKSKILILHLLNEKKLQNIQHSSEFMFPNQTRIPTYMSNIAIFARALDNRASQYFGKLFCTGPLNGGVLESPVESAETSPWKLSDSFTKEQEIITRSHGRSTIACSKQYLL